MKNFYSYMVRKTSEVKKGTVVTLTLPNGVQKIRGKHKTSGKMVDISIRFPKSKFTQESAKNWMKKYKIKWKESHNSATTLEGMLKEENLMNMTDDKNKVTSPPTDTPLTPEPSLLDTEMTGLFGNNWMKRPVERIVTMRDWFSNKPVDEPNEETPSQEAPPKDGDKKTK